jgi:hypothetical protein
VPTVTAANLQVKLIENASRESRLHTGESRLYAVTGEEFAAHETVNHGAKEFARGVVATNSVEGGFRDFLARDDGRVSALLGREFVAVTGRVLFPVFAPVPVGD